MLGLSFGHPRAEEAFRRRKLCAGGDVHLSARFASCCKWALVCAACAGEFSVQSVTAWTATACSFLGVLLVCFKKTAPTRQGWTGA